jgi:hypothetical protein
MTVTRIVPSTSGESTGSASRGIRHLFSGGMVLNPRNAADGRTPLAANGLGPASGGVAAVAS